MKTRKRLVKTWNVERIVRINADYYIERMGLYD
jgi:hypothetical protein